MKRKIFFILAAALMISSFNSPGQALITKKDSISLANDPIVKLAIPQYRGNIQWQKSPDGVNWNDLQSMHSDTLAVKPSVEAIYRAKITDGTCLPVYSDSVGIITNDTITPNYIIPSTSNSVLISDTVDLSQGKYIYVGTEDESLFENGKVIVDTTSRVIRKIIDTIHKGDTIITLTEQATLEDIFLDASFKLSTSIIQPVQNLKNASIDELTNALTDSLGFIHPVSYTIRDEDGRMLKKASVFNENAAESDNALYWHFDINHTLWDFTGSGILPDKDGNYVSLSGTSKCYFSDSYITLDPEFKFEFDFKRPRFSWDEMKFSKGELTLFKFYSDESIFDIKMVLARESDISFTVGKSWSLLPKKLTVSLTYPTMPPLLVDYELDLKVMLSASIGAGVTDYKGFQNKTYVTYGVGYENKDWYLINDVFNNFTPISYSSVHGTTELRLDLYPSIVVKFYKVIGPFFEIGPYLKYNSTRSATNNRDQLIAAGLDARVGVLAGILGYDFLKCSFSGNLLENEIWNSPDKIELVSGNEQTAPVGTQLPLPVKVRVLTSSDEPAKNYQVYFRPLQGTAGSGIVLTDNDGYAQTTWTMSQTPGIHRMEVFLKNGNDEEMHDLKLDIRATAEPVSLTIPAVSTVTASNITQTSATLNGNVTSDGGSAITERGFYWSATITNPGPTSGGTKVTVSGTTGSFSYPLSGLQANTPYYYAAFAVNSQGTGTGEVQSFTTASSVNPTGTFTDSRDAKNYKWVQIGNQWWMAENLAYLPSVSPPASESYTAPYYYVYGYSGTDVNAAKAAANYTTYGVLYNWPAALVSCPAGWHLPSDAEWKQLEMALGMTQAQADATGYRGTDQGTQMKTTYGWYQNGNVTNSSGFSALPGGYRNYLGNFDYVGDGGSWWSSTEYSTDTAWSRTLTYYLTYVYRGDLTKVTGFSVRCLRDF